MNLEEITPVIITFNEEANILRCLQGLAWARQILVVDSGSTDRTLSVCEAFPQVRVMHRLFDSFAHQCNFALSQVSTPWTLSLDADYIAGEDFPETLARAGDSSSVAGYRCAFRYCIEGRPLRGALYPPRVVLYRTALARYEDDGHGHRVQIDGAVERLPAMLDHDDRKPLRRWFHNQISYAGMEAVKLMETPKAKLGRNDRIRRTAWLAPLLILPYCLLVKRGLFDGKAGWFYALQRLTAEVMLSLELISRRLSAPAGGSGSHR